MERQDKMSGTATHEGEEITVHFTATMVKEDYGKGTTSWMEPHDIKVDSVSIFDEDIDFDALPAPLQKKIISLAEGLEWT